MNQQEVLSRRTRIGESELKPFLTWAASYFVLQLNGKRSITKRKTLTAILSRCLHVY